jgi:O-succinylbenzoate synthase
MGFCLGNAIKYVWRADLKDDAIEDLEKAVWYINREIKRRKKLKNMEIWEKKYLDRIATLENQLDNCSHHEAMAHQGGYEIGYAEGLKKASEK